MKEVPLYVPAASAVPLGAGGGPERDVGICALQRYLAHKKTHPPRTLPQPMIRFLGGGAFSLERGTPVRAPKGAREGT